MIMTLNSSSTSAKDAEFDEGTGDFHGLIVLSPT